MLNIGVAKFTDSPVSLVHTVVIKYKTSQVLDKALFLNISVSVTAS